MTEQASLRITPMPFKNDDKRVAYLREYARKRWAVARSDALPPAPPPLSPPDGNEGCSIQMALERGCFHREMMLQFVLPRMDDLVAENKDLIEDYNKLVDEVDEVFLQGQGPKTPGGAERIKHARSWTVEKNRRKRP